MTQNKRVIVQNHPFLDAVDAESRVCIDVLNSIGRPRIAHYGDWTATEQQIVWGDGHYALQTSPEGILAHQRLLNGSDSLQTFLPQQLPDLVRQITRAPDWCFWSKKLNLESRDMDKVNGQVIRVFCDSQMDQTNNNTVSLNFYSASGVFDAYEEIFYTEGEAFAFEVKYYKLANSPGIFFLYFKPALSRFFCPDSTQNNTTDQLYITSNFSMVRMWPNMPMVWFQNCGELKSLDWKILSSKQCIFLYESYTENSLATRNSLAETLAFWAEAKKHGITLSVSQISETPYTCHNDCNMEALERTQVLEMAERNRITVDPILKEDPYRIILNSSLRSSDSVVPLLLYQHELTLFYGSSIAFFMKEILSYLLGETYFPRTLRLGPFPQILLLVSPNYKFRMKTILTELTSDKLDVFTTEKLDEKDMSPLSLADESDVVLFVCQGTPSEKIIDTVDVLLSASKTVGIFCNSEDEPSGLDEMAGKIFFTVQGQEQNYIVKNVKDSNIRRFDFGGKVVEVTDSNEDELAAMMTAE